MPQCRLCRDREPSRNVEMLLRYPGAAPFCPACDRIACGKCQTLLLNGNETRCPNCRSTVKGLTI